MKYFPLRTCQSGQCRPWFSDQHCSGSSRINYLSPLKWGRFCICGGSFCLLCCFPQTVYDEELSCPWSATFYWVTAFTRWKPHMCWSFNKLQPYNCFLWNHFANLVNSEAQENIANSFHTCFFLSQASATWNVVEFQLIQETCSVHHEEILWPWVLCIHFHPPISDSEPFRAFFSQTWVCSSLVLPSMKGCHRSSLTWCLSPLGLFPCLPYFPFLV